MSPSRAARGEPSDRVARPVRSSSRRSGRPDNLWSHSKAPLPLGAPLPIRRRSRAGPCNRWPTSEWDRSDLMRHAQQRLGFARRGSVEPDGSLGRAHVEPLDGVLSEPIKAACGFGIGGPRGKINKSDVGRRKLDQFQFRAQQNGRPFCCSTALGRRRRFHHLFD